jgi:hypothetical protein
MKNLLLAALLAAPFWAFAQISLDKLSPDTFRVQKFPVRYFYAGEKLRKPKQVESILLTKNDLQINRDWQKAQTVRSVGTGVSAIGLVIMSMGLVQQIRGNEGGTNLLVGGAGVMLGGTIVGAFANRPSKRAMGRYNGLHTGRITPEPAGNSPAAAPSVAGGGSPLIGFRTGLNASKFWAIGGSEELQSEEKTWWAKSLPIALTYEMPGASAGHSLLLELALISKGYRIKSETTNSTSTTHSRSDLQMRFVQLSALKRLPIGAQGRKLRFYGEGGLFVGYAAKARLKTRSVLKNDDLKRWTRTLTKREFGDEQGQLDMGRFDAGLALGAGASYPLGPGRISLGLRLSAGAINLQKAEPADPELKLPAVHTRDAGVWVGWSVGI